MLNATEVRRRLWMGLRLWTVDITYHCVIMKGFLQNSPDIFKLSAHIYKENAEGVISRSVTVTEVAVRHSARANPSSLSVPPMTVEIEEVEKTRLDEIPRLDAV